MSYTLPAQDSLSKIHSLSKVTIGQKANRYKSDDNPMNLDYISTEFLQQSNASQILDALQWVSGIRSQVTCNVCQTADIRINGMEGTNTLVLIDGMPIVSGLGTVYGLYGIPSGMIHRIEIAKGPANARFGAEAIAGTINIITQKPKEKSSFFSDVQWNTYGEKNLDFSSHINVNKHISTLIGVNGHHFDIRHDVNQDNFIDKALATRGSLYNKWSFELSEKSTLKTSFRLIGEDRLGGELNFLPEFKGNDSIYGEYINTRRGEFYTSFNHYFDTMTDLQIQSSFNYHNQESYYGDMAYLARQFIGFAQGYLTHQFRNHKFQVGMSHRWTLYDDNTSVTLQPYRIYMPGLWLEDNFNLGNKLSVLMSARADFTSVHGLMISPRMGLKWSVNPENDFRLNFGMGNRIVNVFSEDHAALTGGREVKFLEDLKPEQSINAYLGYLRHVDIPNGFVNIDFGGFYNYFSNKIIANYDIDPELVVYQNLKEYALNFGASVQIDAQWLNGIKANLSATALRSFWMEEGKEVELLYTPNFSVQTTLAYLIPKVLLNVTFQGIYTGPMRMPVFENDYRPSRSPGFFQANLNFSKKIFKNKVEIYGGILNVFQYLPKVDVIMRAFDPFDRKVTDPFNNPNNFSFDPSYNFASLQVRSFLLGLRLKF
ncbi:MAG: TonB-dependent receptor [Chitinophagales bacterium]|nr:TonB-dependent receptor [Chitinophagales bacterium]